MSIKRYKLEQIVALLRQIEVGIANGKTTPKSGKVVMKTILETKALTILQFVHGLRGTLHPNFEEGAWAA